MTLPRLAYLLALSFTGFAQCGETPVPDSEFRWDRFSGVSVTSERQANTMIMFRFSSAPRNGETAPDGLLVDAESGEEVTLHSLIREKPLVLIFGSSSCNQLELFEKEFGPFLKRYGDRFDFAFIYIRAAHPEGGFQPETQRENQASETQTESVADTTARRRLAAKAFAESLGTPLPFYVDLIDDALAVRWGAWPSRIFVIDTDMTTIYSGGPGPWYFDFTRDGWHSKPPEIMERIFQQSPFDRISLEEFLDNREQ